MKSLFTIALIVVGIYAWNVYRQALLVPACSQPITYAIGSFDRRFGISYKEFLSALSEAEAIWEGPSGINLFNYSPENKIIDINLVYDYRQEVTKTLSTIGEVVEENESTYKSLNERFKQLKSRYDLNESVYKELVAVFNEKNAEYDQMVEEWNGGPRTSKKQFQELEQKKSELQTDLSELKTLEAKLNEEAREVNSLVDKLNRLAKSLNLDVEKFNTIGATRGETFTGGLYSVEGANQSIDIFEFKNKEKLVRVLAHELGHALGLEHVDDKDAIMYYLNEGEAGALTGADKAALKALCGIMQ